MNKRKSALMAASITLMTFVSVWPSPAVAATPQAIHRVRPGQRQHSGDPDKAALKIVTAAQADLTKGNWENAYSELLLADDEIMHMHPKAASAPSGNAKGRPDIGHMQAMRADLRMALDAIEKGEDAKAQSQLESLKSSIDSMKH